MSMFVLFVYFFVRKKSIFVAKFGENYDDDY